MDLIQIQITVKIHAASAARSEQAWLQFRTVPALSTAIQNISPLFWTTAFEETEVLAVSPVAGKKYL